MYGNIDVDTYGSTPEIGIDFRYPKIAYFRRSTPVGHVFDVTADVKHMLFVLEVWDIRFSRCFAALD